MGKANLYQIENTEQAEGQNDQGKDDQGRSGDHKPIEVKDQIFYHIQKIDQGWKVGDKKYFGNALNFQQNCHEESLQIKTATGETAKVSDLIETEEIFLNTGNKVISWYHYNPVIAFRECRWTLFRYYHTLLEVIIEEERIKHFPEFPSRKTCIWLLDDYQEALNYWWNEFLKQEAKFNNPKIIKLRVNGKIHRSDNSYFWFQTLGLTDIRKLAFDYWSGIPGREPFEEIMFAGEAEILEIKNPAECNLMLRNQADILSIEPYEPVKQIWVNVLSGCMQSNPASPHSLNHWIQVEKNGLLLAEKNGADKIVVSLFALFHDISRISDGQDPEHGYRSAIVIESFRKELNLTDEQISKLTFACVKHTDGQISDDITIGTCWDADRLDLPRVGKIPDISLLSTNAGKEMAQKNIVYPAADQAPAPAPAPNRQQRRHPNKNLQRR